jgi:hypothetical protein
LWLAPLFGKPSGGAARAALEKVTTDTATIVTAAYAFRLFVLAMLLLVAIF